MPKKNNRFQSHFRKFRNAKFTGHPTYVYDEEGRRYKVIGITSSASTNGVSNIPLDVNPEPNNPEKAYIRPKPDTVDKGVENVRLKGWRFVASDKPKVQSVIDGDKNSKKKKPHKK